MVEMDRSIHKTMEETQVTTMEIKVVDLGCEKCRKKIKKLLCKIPRDAKYELFLLVPKKVAKFCGFSQIYAQEKNTVTITVVCCSPEKIKRKLLCKGQGHRVFRGKMVALAAEEEVTLCVDVNISVKIITRHAHPCKGPGKLRILMIKVNVQHQPLNSNPAVMMDS
ncbi:hypothetical protein SADUNF_Sadunf06G0014000 [Salix dunnii]|uniref:HMA domain-containing protein n=1 Tax=Salix dunnii TaxID=1413687 RepID=A0A835JX50_9ROSI|nr:hypothetical protein SADUNF_Sadunf06G0014000 [Salix dunnii]